MIVIDMDMPKNCEECPCFDNAYGECQIDAKNTIGFADLEERSPRCPIKCDIKDIKAEIEQVEINGHIRDVECFRAGINTALDIIDKYR